MSKLEELIQELCPNGVPFVKLEELCPVMRGKRLTKSQLSDDGQYVVYHGSKDTPLGFYDDYNVEGDTVIVVNTGGIGGVKYIKDNFWCSDGSFWIKHNDRINNKFLYYYLIQYEGYYLSQKRVGGVPTIDKSVVSNTRIPVPPLEVQCEIVRILDKFTLLTAELTAELTARRKQYEYYRNYILNNVEAEKKELSDVCDFLRGPFGSSLKKEYFRESGYVVYEQQHAIYQKLDFRYFIDADKFAELKRFEVNPGELIVSCSGTIGKVFVIPENAPKGIINQALLNLKPKDFVKVKYIKYFFENTLGEVLNNSARGGAIKNVPSVSELKKIKIHIPSKNEQQKIISFLERFDKLCNDITNGLPAEIEARQKQYEYYRDKLLTFKEQK